MRFHKTIYLNTTSETSSNQLEVSEGKVIDIFYNKEQLILNTHYQLSNNIIEFLIDVDGYIILELESPKNKLVGFKEEGVYCQFDTEVILDTNSIYVLCFKHKGINFSSKFRTKLEPMYCTVKDINILIKPILESIKEKDFDIEFEIHYVSKDLLDNFLDEDFDFEGKGKALKKLTAYKVAYNLVYRFYYMLVSEFGSESKQVGTLQKTQARQLVALEDLIRRFEKEIGKLEDDINNQSSISNSFLKAKDSIYPIKGRLWDN